MFLSIDTSSNKKAIIELDGETFEIESGFGSARRGAFRRRSEFAAQNVLPLIEKILKKKGANLSDLTGIKVNTGPGSFTGLKVGVTIANTLGYLLGIPVNGKEIGPKSIVEPEYG